MIKDSGERREFESGAVRDIQQGKGRCDLLPLDIWNDKILTSISCYIRCGDKGCIEDAVSTFCEEIGWDFATALLEVAKHYEEGCGKYGERNWEKGIPAHCFVDSGIRHYLKWLRNDFDEPHDRAFLWNMFCLLWTVKHKPELIDLPFAKEEER